MKTRAHAQHDSFDDDGGKPGTNPQRQQPKGEEQSREDRQSQIITSMFWILRHVAGSLPRERSEKERQRA